MNDTLKGSIQDVAGKVQDAVGGAAGDVSLQAEGKVRQGFGKLQQTTARCLINSGNPPSATQHSR